MHIALAIFVEKASLATLLYRPSHFPSGRASDGVPEGMLESINVLSTYADKASVFEVIRDANASWTSFWKMQFDDFDIQDSIELKRIHLV